MLVLIEELVLVVLSIMTSGEVMGFNLHKHPAEHIPHKLSRLIASSTHSF